MPTLRKRLLVDEWVAIAPERAGRPRQLGLVDRSTDQPCPFCPGESPTTPPPIADWKSPAFPDRPWAVRSVPNKFPSVRLDAPTMPSIIDPVDDAAPYLQRPGVGAHEVIIESPDHHTDWTQLPVEHLAVIFSAWQQRMAQLAGDSRLQSVICFKNHGAVAGETLGHVHSQLVALPDVAPQLQRELLGASRYYDKHQGCTLCDMLDHERKTGRRLIAENDQASAVAPFASRMAYETWILPRDHQGDFLAATASQLRSVARLVARVLTAWRTLIGPVAYNLILHCLPFDFVDEPYYHWHLEMLPRSGQIAGLELGTDIFVNSIPSELAARQLRNPEAESN